ncbi:MAG TPA: UDP-N-acetylmuramoyl-tripeptide--D-alanyl-D-alanine ligase [Conexibacter sp.]|jgi:UDP-N-acetylmuramoyl-tripeptide--D-alanyl-D-alanine ligase|nr:UDP-N-acetylmuramoyl-tripeptide--D-alanyl-D-alanine ligase [Conexibacter sp.]
MRSWTPEQVAQAAGARLAAPAPAGAAGPTRAAIDSRAVAPGDLFVGLPGETHDGGRFTEQALAAGAWGVLVAPQHAEDAAAGAPSGVLLAADDPLAALQSLARSWRRELGAQTIAITGSTGKTSTKDILAALLAPHRRTFVSRGNFNTEIGLPLELLAAPEGTEALVLEMGMRAAGQIAELAQIAEPDVGVIVNVGPAHLERLGSIEAIAAAKAELIADLHGGATAVIPAGEPLLDPHRRDDVATVTFGPGGDVTLARQDPDGAVEIDAQGERIALQLDFRQAHLRGNLLAAVAAARAIGVKPAGAVTVAFSGRRGERTRLSNGVTVIDDCYNANPMSMRAALDDLAATAGEGRRVAVLGDMLELGPEEVRFHAEIGAHAATLGVDLLVAVGPRSRELADAFGDAGEAVLAPDAARAAALVPGLVRPGDTVLVKASRGVGLERVAEALANAAEAPA